MGKVIGLVCLFFIGTIHAGTIADFHERFKVVRDDNGKIDKVVARRLSREHLNISLKEMVYSLNKDLQWRHEGLKSLGLKKDLRLLIKKIINKREIENPEETLNQLLASIDASEFQRYVSNKKVSEVFNEIDHMVKKDILPSYPILARPNKKFYFYKRNLFRQIRKGVVSAIKSLLPFGAWLDITSYLSNRFLNLLQENKRYHQELLLSYLQQFSAEELGLSEKEKKRIYSSVMEAQVPFYAVWEVVAGCLSWNSYGERKVGKRVQKSVKRIGKHFDRFQEVGPYYGSHFSRAKNKKGKDVIVNWLDPIYLFTSLPSTTFQFERPWAYTLERSVYEVVKFAVRFIPWGFVGTIVDPLLNARYIKQIPHEADLYGQLEGKHDLGIEKHLLRQSINPFIVRTVPLGSRTSSEGMEMNLLGF